MPNVFGFPDRLLTRVRYSDIVNLPSTVGSLATYVFRWNSTFDPDFTSTGHQPLYRDTYASIYDQYSVVSAHATLTPINPSATINMLVGYTTDDDTTASTSFQTLMEQSRGTSTLLTPLSGSRSSTVFNTSWDCQGVLGIDPYTSETYKTAVGSNPAEVSTLILWSIPGDGSSTVNTQWKVEIVQEVLWTELQTPAQS